MSVSVNCFVGSKFSSEKGVFVNLEIGILVVTPNLLANSSFQSVDVISVTIKISQIKIIKPLVSWHHRVISLKLAPLSYFKSGLHRKTWKIVTCKIGYGILNEMKELGLDHLKHDYMHIKGHKRGHGTSRNLKVVAESSMVLVGIVEVLKGNFMSLGLVYLHIHSLMFLHGQIINIENYS